MLKNFEDIRFSTLEQIRQFAYAAENLGVGTKMSANGLLIEPAVYDISQSRWYAPSMPDDEGRYAVESGETLFVSLSSIDVPPIEKDYTAEELSEISFDSPNILRESETGWIQYNKDTIYSISNKKYAKVNFVDKPEANDVDTPSIKTTTNTGEDEEPGSGKADVLIVSSIGGSDSQ